MSSKADAASATTKAHPSRTAGDGDGNRAAEIELKIEGTPSLVDAEPLERALRGVRGVLDASVEPSGRVLVKHVPGEVEFSELKAIGDAAGYSLARPGAQADTDPQEEAQAR